MKGSSRPPLSRRSHSFTLIVGSVREDLGRVGIISRFKGCVDKEFGLPSLLVIAQLLV